MSKSKKPILIKAMSFQEMIESVRKAAAKAAEEEAKLSPKEREALIASRRKAIEDYYKGGGTAMWVGINPEKGGTK